LQLLPYNITLILSVFFFCTFPPSRKDKIRAPPENVANACGIIRQRTMEGLLLLLLPQKQWLVASLLWVQESHSWTLPGNSWNSEGIHAGRLCGPACKHWDAKENHELQPTEFGTCTLRPVHGARKECHNLPTSPSTCLLGRATLAPCLQHQLLQRCPPPAPQVLEAAVLPTMPALPAANHPHGGNLQHPDANNTSP